MQYVASFFNHAFPGPIITNEQERHWHHEEIEWLGQGAEKPPTENSRSSLPPYAFPGVAIASFREGASREPPGR